MVSFLSGNSAAVGGGIASIFGTIPEVHNCILWGDIPDEFSTTSEPFFQYSNVQGGQPGVGNIDADPLFVDPAGGDYRLQPGSPCIDAAENAAVPNDIMTDLGGNPRFLEVPETPDTGTGELPIVDMGAFEAVGGGCLALTSQDVVCHADGTTFSVNLEGLVACTGGISVFTFTGSGGSAGEPMCLTVLVSDGGFCCTSEICVTIPDCSQPPLSCDLDGDGVVGVADFVALLAVWGPCGDCGECPSDFDGDCTVGMTDMLDLLKNWSA